LTRFAGVSSTVVGLARSLFPDRPPSFSLFAWYDDPSRPFAVACPRAAASGPDVDARSRASPLARRRDAWSLAPLIGIVGSYCARRRQNNDTNTPRQSHSHRARARHRILRARTTIKIQNPKSKI
jgi:hypothetical protein